MAEEKTKEKKADEAQNTIWSRREFFSLAGWAGFLGSLGLSSLYFARLLFPRVLFEPSPIFKAGYPTDYTVGAVSTKYIRISEFGLFAMMKVSMWFMVFAPT